MRPLKVVNGVAPAQQEQDPEAGPDLKLTSSKRVSPVGQPNHLLDEQNPHLKWADADTQPSEAIHEENHQVGDMILDSRPINLFNETFDHDCLSMLPAEEAWRNLVLPIRMHAGSLICATTKSMLDDALALLQQHVKDTPVKVTLVESHLLEMFIAERYGYEGVDAED